MENTDHSERGNQSLSNGVEPRAATDNVKRSEYKKCTVQAQRITISLSETLDKTKRANLETPTKCQKLNVHRGLCAGTHHLCHDQKMNLHEIRCQPQCDCKERPQPHALSI
jgi:hypothetical protein